MADKKHLTAAQGMDAACILFELNSKREHIVNLAFGAEIPEACLTEPGALPCSSTQVTISAARRRANTKSTATGKAWRWRASSCRTARIIRNGRSRTACCARVKSTLA